MSLRKIQDTITPDLKRKARALSPAGRKKALEAMGMAVVSMGMQAFTQAGLRAAAWAPRKDSLPHALLQKSTTLRKSLVSRADATRATIRSDRPYAAVHQLGGSAKQNIPARPYLPFDKGGRLTALGSQRVGNALRATLRASGL
jgi:phage virion morphogenesis protein